MKLKRRDDVRKPRYLTKSRFKLALECPAKLFYTGKEGYVNSKAEDSFLEALADGGIQVGELAKKYYPAGVDVSSLGYDESLSETNELLERDNVVIFEAAIKFENLFIRVDVLEKQGNRISLFEVKSKSYEPADDSFFGARGKISAAWRPYLEDVAFQKHVVSSAFPNWTATAHLTLIDKSSSCPSDALNQKFRLHTEKNGRKRILSTPLTEGEISERILVDINVDDACNEIYDTLTDVADTNYASKVDRLSQAYANDLKIPSVVTSACKKCEFFASDADLNDGLKCGKSECWGEALGWTPDQVREPTVLDIHNFRNKDKLIEKGVIRMSDVVEEDIGPNGEKRAGLSNSERQWLQVKKMQDGDDTPWIDRENLSNEIVGWRFPLHFIDFETANVAIPFNKGRRPYEGIAFQFSHHRIESDGHLEHVDEFLDASPSHFPNYDFVRALRTALAGDDGTIFRYADHENTFLNHIYRQLRADNADISDRDELCDFIQLITKSGRSSAEKWEGRRSMVDLCDVVKRFYFDPRTRGSSSIKAVLPAILGRSELLQKRYSRPVYGTTEMRSKNFLEMTWVVFDEGTLSDPYALLPPVFEDVSDRDMLLLSQAGDELHEGGAAMTAYARLQFEEMRSGERKAIETALLKYCELDTLAMVMVYEGLRDMAGRIPPAESEIQRHLS